MSHWEGDPQMRPDDGWLPETSPKPTRPLPEPVYEVSYLKLDIRLSRSGATCDTNAGGSGSARMRLDELPTWLSNRPGTMIVSIRRIL